MKLRIARKIVKAVGTSNEFRYSQKQIRAAIDRVKQTRSAKEDDEFWHGLMSYLGPVGRADLLCGAFHAPADAFALLMRTPEEEWVGYGGRKHNPQGFSVPPQTHH